MAARRPTCRTSSPPSRKRGILQPLIVRPADADGRFGIAAGSRRFTADALVFAEGIDHGPLPCAILDPGDDADAIEASMIENLARLDPGEVRQWETFVRLAKEGRSVEDIAETFGLPPLAITRILALGNLLPRIRAMYAKDAIDRATVRHLTLASKSQQRSWLALVNAPDAHAPTGHVLKAWLFGGASIAARHALFDLESFAGATVADLFGEDRYFADPGQFWAAQNAAIETRRQAYLAAGWSDVVIVPPTDRFSPWEHEKTPKRRGGRVYVEVRGTGEVVFHEGYVTCAEARRIARGEPPIVAKPARPEIGSTLNRYIDLHRHAAVRAALLGHPGASLRLMVAHAICGSPLWKVDADRRTVHGDAIAESVETARGETVFDERRRAVLALLGFDPERAHVTGGSPAGLCDAGSDADRLAAVFLRLMALPDACVGDIIGIVMGETLAVGSVAVAAVGTEIGIDIADWWQADDAMLDLVRDRETLGYLVRDVAGPVVADANRGEKAKTLRRIVRDHLGGVDGRARVERWVPRWMAFPPSAYTMRGGIATVTAHAAAEASRTVAAQCATAPVEAPRLAA